MPSKQPGAKKKAPKPITPDESFSESNEEYEEEMSVGSEELEELDENGSASDVSSDGGELEEDPELELDMEEVEEMAFKRQGLLDLLEAEPSDKSSKSDKDSTGKTYNRGKGVVYISRLPPGATAHQLRSLLAPYGEIGRVWIEMPESISQDRNLSKTKLKRISRSVSKEAWVEFERAKKAWKAARLLHMQPMGTGRYRHDLWNIKYLKDFSWNDLVNQHLHKGKMREARLRQSVARAKAEATQFMENRTKQENADSRNLKKRSRPESSAAPSAKPDFEPMRRKIAMQSAPAPASKSNLLSTDLLSKVCSKICNIPRIEMYKAWKTDFFDSFSFSTSFSEVVSHLSLPLRSPSLKSRFVSKFCIDKHVTYAPTPKKQKLYAGMFRLLYMTTFVS